MLQHSLRKRQGNLLASKLTRDSLTKKGVFHIDPTLGLWVGYPPGPHYVFYFPQTGPQGESGPEGAPRSPMHSEALRSARVETQRVVQKVFVLAYGNHTFCVTIGFFDVRICS